MDNNGSHLIKKQLKVCVMQDEDAYPIPISDWNFLKKKIDRIKSYIPLYHSIGIALIGASLTAVLTGIASKSPIFSIFFILSAIFFVIGLLLLHFSSQQRKVITINKDDVLEEMDRIECRYNKPKYFTHEGGL